MLPGWTTDVPRNPVQSTEEKEEINNHVVIDVVTRWEKGC
jgi:hypothetical protein